MSKLTISVQAVTENVEAGLKALGDFKRLNLTKAPASASPVSNISRPGTPAMSRAETQVCKTGVITDNYADDVINAMKECIKGLDEEAADDLDYGKDPKNPSKLNKIFNNTLRNYITPLVGDPNKQERQIPKGEYFKLYKPTKLILTGTAQTAAGSTWVLDPSPKPSYLEIKLTVDKNPTTRKYSRISNSEPRWVNPKGGERESAQTIYYFALKQSKTPFTDEEPHEPEANASNNGAAKKQRNNAAAAEAAAQRASNAAAAEAKAAAAAAEAERVAREAEAASKKQRNNAAAAEEAAKAKKALNNAKAEEEAAAAASKEAERVAEALAQKQRNNSLHAARVASLKPSYCSKIKGANAATLKDIDRIRRSRGFTSRPQTGKDTSRPATGSDEWARQCQVFTPFEPQKKGGRQTKKNRQRRHTRRRQRR